MVCEAMLNTSDVENFSTKTEWEKMFKTFSQISLIDTRFIMIFVFCFLFTLALRIDASMQDCSNPITNAMELLQPCTKPSR